VEIAFAIAGAGAIGLAIASRRLPSAIATGKAT
jgi:hypothetical protein